MLLRALDCVLPALDLDLVFIASDYAFTEEVSRVLVAMWVCLLTIGDPWTCPIFMFVKSDVCMLIRALDCFLSAPDFAQNTFTAGYASNEELRDVLIAVWVFLLAI